MEKKIVIFTGGSYGPADFYQKQLQVLKPDAVIAADRGAEMCAQLGLVPDVMVGDFDSIDPAIFAFFKAKGVKIVRHPVHKDQTDTELAIDVAMRYGATALTLLGATGTRLDHVLASVAALIVPAKAGIVARMVDTGNDLRLFCGPRDIHLSLPEKTTVSLTALSDRTGPVTLSGFEYPLEAQMLSFADAGFTVSNFAAAPEQRIAFDAGILLVDVVREQESAQAATAR